MRCRLSSTPSEIVGRGRQGRDAWLREGKRQLEQHRWENPDSISRSRAGRLLLAAERLGSDLDVERRANEAYEHYRATARDRLGRRPGGRAEPYQPPELPAGKVNTTDPDSRPIPIGFGFVQGYNAQAAVNEQQIVLAAEITNISTDFSQLDPMVTATLGELERAGIDQLPDAVAADAGYWNEQHMDEVVANKHIPVLVAPDKGTRGTPKRWLTSGRASWMRAVLATEHGQQRYRKRKQTVEPLFGNTKHNGGFYRFHRRGRTKVRLEWRLLMMTHNLPRFTATNSPPCGPKTAPQPRAAAHGGARSRLHALRQHTASDRPPPFARRSPRRPAGVRRPCLYCVRREQRRLGDLSVLAAGRRVRAGSVVLGLLDRSQGPRGRGVDALVSVVPADAVARRGCFVKDLLDDARARWPLGRLRLDLDPHTGLQLHGPTSSSLHERHTTTGLPRQAAGSVQRMLAVSGSARGTDGRATRGDAHRCGAWAQIGARGANPVATGTPQRDREAHHAGRRGALDLTAEPDVGTGDG